MGNESDILNRFTYHRPFGTQPDRYEKIRWKAMDMANLIVVSTPFSREQSISITKLEEVVFWANAAIARNESEV